MKKVRAPVVDEIFYPAEAEALAAQVRSLLERCDLPKSEASALILPHAAYSLVGGLLAAGFCAAGGRRVERVVFLAPVHRDAGNKIVLPESHAFLTPLGEAAVDAETVEALEGWSTAIVRSDMPHLEEHSVEVCLPFVQVVFPSATIVPILLGRIPQGLVRTLAHALASVLAPRRDSTLVIASTNLNGDSGGLREADRFLRAVGAAGGRSVRATARSAAIIEGVRSGRITACGALAVATLLELAPAAAAVRLLGRGDSGQEAPTRTYYAALALQ